MAKEITIVFPHTLGQEEAHARVVDAVERARAGYTEGVLSSDVTWNGRHADLAIGALGQNILAQIDVEPQQVRVSVTLPWLFERLSGSIADRITQIGRSTFQIGSSRTSV
jgi:hypothetical protein